MKTWAGEARSFLSELQIVRGFRRKSETVEAEISYELIDGRPVFRGIVVDGSMLPKSYVTDSELLKAYARHRSLSL